MFNFHVYHFIPGNHDGATISLRHEQWQYTQLKIKKAYHE